MDIEEKRYSQMENILNKINQKYISLPKDQKKINGKILETIMETMTKKLKEKDDLFRHVYEKILCGGSYYDGIKVGKPEEYDLDSVLNLPLLAEPDVEISDRPGFVYIRINEYAKLLKSPDGKKFEKLNTLMDGQYLSTPKVLSWMESIIGLALNDIEKDELGNYFEVEIEQNKLVKIYVSLSKSHPAFTLKLRNKDYNIIFDIDLVPCFQFNGKKWPKGDYRPNPKPSRDKFLVVPKKPYESSPSEDVSKYWRLSFQEQERDLIKGYEYNKMKPTIKLLKFIRDKYNHKIASYFIKTVFLWEIHERDNVAFWAQPLSYVFMKMLEKYANMLEKKSIPYYWNKNFNLIGHLKSSTVTVVANFIKRLVNDVNKNLDDPFRIAKYMLSSEDVEIFRSEVTLGKKYQKKNDPDLSLEDSVDDLEASTSLGLAPYHNFSNVEINVKKTIDPEKSTSEDSVDGSEGRSTQNGMSASSSSSGISSKHISRGGSSNLRNYLANSSDMLADVIEQLCEQNKELQESNRAILRTCRQLEERVANLERKCDKLTHDNGLLIERNIPSGFSTSEIDKLNLTVSFF
ncbi:cyclic GMP-AMP synthase-like receptor [Leptinotarsa decemlineata]|uniref:cyclic GMP-AMP synthase-like receptor n=1 Tax=Leptinotarsa decemlineata TaxID=7539 RepID=UPI003D307775